MLKIWIMDNDNGESSIDSQLFELLPRICQYLHILHIVYKPVCENKTVPRNTAANYF